jgi:signal transduction histidine kinase
MEKSHPFLKGGGEMGRLIRSYDWSLTPVGIPDQWPQSLRTIIGVILSCRFPMFLWWGETLIQFYNDAYRPSLGNNGKHPTALGQKGEDCWPEIWPVIKPLIDQVLAGGESTWSEDQLIPIYRNGKLEDVYWTFSYSPVCDETGKTAGVLVTCTETTDKIINLQQLTESKALLESAVARTLQDITEQEQQKKTLKEVEANLRGAIELAELGTWAWDAKTDKVTYSDRMQSWFGFPNETTTLEEKLQAIDEEDRPLAAYTLEYALNPVSGGRYDIEYTIINLVDGKRRILHLNGKTTFDETGKPVSLNGTARDITIQRQLQLALENEVQQQTEELATANEELLAANEELEEANTRLQHSNEELEQYAYVASHDLQEPLRKIRIFSDVLKKQQNLAVESNDLIEKIQGSAERMSMLIKDLLEFSRLSKDAILMQPVNLNETVAAVIGDFELKIKEKNAVIEVANLPDIEAIGLQMNQLFNNLLSNALKFTAPGVIPHITLRSSLIALEEVSKYITKPFMVTAYYRFIFTDNGIGFEEEYAEQVFEIFKRLHGRNIYPGSGIGLALCRRIVANHNGYLFADSKPGKGTSFHIILPGRQCDL